MPNGKVRASRPAAPMTPTDAPTPSRFYVTGGTLPADASSYIERQADRDLLAALRAGEYCYVLNTRQMGKSSLMIRTAARLRDEGFTVAILDLTAIGQNLTPEQWYDGLLLSLASTRPGGGTGAFLGRQPPAGSSPAVRDVRDWWISTDPKPCGNVAWVGENAAVRAQRG